MNYDHWMWSNRDWTVWDTGCHTAFGYMDKSKAILYKAVPSYIFVSRKLYLEKPTSNQEKTNEAMHKKQTPKHTCTAEKPLITVLRMSSWVIAISCHNSYFTTTAKNRGPATCIRATVTPNRSLFGIPISTSLKQFNKWNKTSLPSALDVPSIKTQVMDMFFCWFQYSSSWKMLEKNKVQFCLFVLKVWPKTCNSAITSIKGSFLHKVKENDLKLTWCCHLACWYTLLCVEEGPASSHLLPQSH